MAENFGSYEHYRRWYRDISNDFTRTATEGDLTLQAGRANYTIFVQRIIVYVTTNAAVSWSFEDDAGTVKRIANIPSSPGVDTRWEFDFGARGVPLTQGNDFELNVSAAGLAGHGEYYGYMRPTAPIDSTAGATLQ